MWWWSGIGEGLTLEQGAQWLLDAGVMAALVGSSRSASLASWVLGNVTGVSVPETLAADWGNQMDAGVLDASWLHCSGGGCRGESGAHWFGGVAAAGAVVRPCRVAGTRESQGLGENNLLV